MKTQDNRFKYDFPLSLHHIHYLRTGSKKQHKPYADNKGIHCTGDSFGYIVDWQVSEEKAKKQFAGADSTPFLF